MGMIKVVRYSNSGFEPLYQEKMKRLFDYHINFEESSLPAYLTEFSRELILRETMRTRSLLDHSFSFWGIHVFVGDPNEDLRNLQLNHLKGPTPLRHEAYMDPETPCRRLNEPCLLDTKLTLQEAFDKRVGAVFIESPFSIESVCAA
jgi:hypothetical protein